MGILTEIQAFVGGSVADTGLLATAWTLTFRDGSTESFNGTFTDYDSDDDGIAGMLHCKLTGEPQLMDRVTASDSTVYHISGIKKDLGIFSLTLVGDARYIR